MDIYWIKDKRRCGPATVADVLSLLQMGELTPESLGWHVGCGQWLPLRELPALADFLQPRGEAAAEKEPSGEGALLVDGAAGESAAETLPVGAVRVYLPTPWQRAASYLVDASLYAAFALLFLYGASVPFSEYCVPWSPVFWAPMLFLQAWVMTVYRTTPGMKLFGISLSVFGQSGLSFSTLLFRNVMVYFMGAGMLLFPFAFVMAGISLALLKWRGITPWDARCGTLPVQRTPSTPGRLAAAAAIILISMYVAGFCMQPWMPDMLRYMEEQSPEAARVMRSYLPEESGK